MSRDIRFEIEYLLSLTVATLGFLSIRGIEKYLDERVAYSFLILISIHLLIFNSYYVFSRIMDVQLVRMPELITLSRYSFYSVSVFFSYLFSHILATRLFNSPVICPDISAPIEFISGELWCTETQFFIQVDSRAKILIMYASPIVGVLVFMAPLLAVVPSLDFFDDIEVVVSPTDIEITDNFEETIPVSISLLNNGKDTHEFTVTIDLPDDVDLRHNGATFKDSFEESVELTNTNPADKFTVNFRYDGSSRSHGEIPIEIHHRFTTKTQIINAELYP